MSNPSDRYSAQLNQLDAWHKLVAKEKEQYRTFADAIEVFLPVSAFIAGVQAQIITLTIRDGLPVTPLGRAANLFGFVGLILDINGTIAGVYDTLFVQGRISDLTTLLSHNSELQTEIKASNKAGASRNNKEISEGSTTVEPYDGEPWADQYTRFSQEMLTRYPHGKLRPTSWISFYFMTEHILGPTPSNPWLLLLKPLRALFLMPAQTMLFGIMALKVSIIMYAVANPDLQREVWVCCVVIFFSSMARLMLHALVPPLVEMRKRRKANREAAA